jgi:hypothetical protein
VRRPFHRYVIDQRGVAPLSGVDAMPLVLVVFLPMLLADFDHDPMLPGATARAAIIINLRILLSRFQQDG